MKNKTVFILLCFFMWMLSGPIQAVNLKPPMGEKPDVAQKVTTEKKAKKSYIYHFRVDGLACPFCAYGIEKKFKRMQGVTHVDIDFKKGLVIVTSSRLLTSFDREKFFNETGFTYRGTVKSP